MIVFRSPEEVPDDFGPSAVAIGKFDGVDPLVRRDDDQVACDHNPPLSVRP